MCLKIDEDDRDVYWNCKVMAKNWELKKLMKFYSKKWSKGWEFCSQIIKFWNSQIKKFRTQNFIQQQILMFFPIIFKQIPKFQHKIIQINHLTPQKKTLPEYRSFNPENQVFPQYFCIFNSSKKHRKREISIKRKRIT